VDFADVKYVMTSGGAAIMGSASAEGERRALKAVQGALNSPLLNDNDIRGAKKILVNISSGLDEQVTIDEITEINEYIQEVAKDTDIIFGTCDDNTMGSKLSVTIIATGFEATYKPAFLTPVNKIVRDLNEEVKEKPTVSVPQVKHPMIKETAQLNLISLDDEPVVKKPTMEVPVMQSTPAVTEEKNTIHLEEEEPYTLFSMMEGKSEDTPSENVVVFEFETTNEVQPELIHEEMIHAVVVEEVMVQEEFVSEVKEEITETVTPELAAAVREEKEEESFVVFNVKSYENNAVETVSQESQDRVLNDRKRILSQLSYRSLNKGNMNELETTPAYLRKGVEVQNTMHSNNTDLSRYTIGEDTINQRPEVRKNNSFLHDNVD
jgi:cell division protein FtsZ